MKRWVKREDGLDSRPAHEYKMIVDHSIKLKIHNSRRLAKAEQSLTLVIPDCLLCRVSLVRVESVLV